jgi:cellulose synthase/poly-beta-1,6-N-acetylglucosamine synthase-like glycosyltransferase
MNEIAIFLESLVILFFGLLLLIFGTYGTIILYYNKAKKNHSNRVSASTQYEPTVSLVIPTHNEASIISKRIGNLLDTKYPKEKLEIIFVDDSNDCTWEIIEQYSKKEPLIHLLRFNQRMGYSPSLVAGCKAAKGEIVVFAEASSFLERDTLYHLVKNFRDPKIGAVTGKGILLNLDENMGQSENSYLKILDFLRQGESNMDSTVYMKGEAAAVRKELITDIDKLDAPGTADTAIALFVRRKGFRFVFDPEVKFYEYAPSTREDRIKQKTIRAANLIKVIWSLRDLFFRREYGKFGSIILPFNFAMLAFVPLTILLAAISLAALAFFEPVLSLTVWAIILAFFIIGLIVSRKIVVTFFEFEYSLLKALCEILFLRKSHDKIEKVVSTRRAN